MKIFRLFSLVVAFIAASPTWGFSPDYQGHGTPIYRADKGLITDFDVTTSGVLSHGAVFSSMKKGVLTCALIKPQISVA